MLFKIKISGKMNYLIRFSGDIGKYCLTFHSYMPVVYSGVIFYFVPFILMVHSIYRHVLDVAPFNQYIELRQTTYLKLIRAMVKKLILITAGMCYITILQAQKWQMPIYNISDITRVKTLKIKPEMNIEIRSIVLDTDSLKLTKKYKGAFLGATEDTLRINLTDFSEFKNYTNGIVMQTTVPGKHFIMSPTMDTGLAGIPLTEINYISFKSKGLEKIAGAAEAGVFISLFAIALSPLICIDYKEGEFNSDRYTYWGVGSALAIACSLCLEITLSGSKAYQFKTNWPDKKKKVWGFKQN
jgi:hypothetical protein